MSIELTGPYYATSFMEGVPNSFACGWPGLKIGDFIPGRPAPYRIDRSGTAMGQWSVHHVPNTAQCTTRRQGSVRDARTDSDCLSQTMYALCVTTHSGATMACRAMN